MLGLKDLYHDPSEPGDSEQLAFLQLLERNLPDHIVCTSCVKLHRPRRLADLKAIPWYHGSHYGMWKPKCLEEDHKRGVSRYFYSGLSFDRVRMALKCERLGLNWREYVDDVAFSEAEREDEIHPQYRQGRNNWFLFQHRIFDGEMYIRARQWFLVPREDRQGISIARFGHVRGRLGASAIYTYWNRFRRAMECRVRHVLNGEPPCYSCQQELISCDYCPTEACIDIRLFADRIVLVVTKWMRIGPGESREDRSWRRRLRRAESEVFEREATAVDAVLWTESAAAAQELRDSAFGYGNNPFLHNKGSVRGVFNGSDTRSRLFLSAEHERQMLDVVLR